MRFRNENRAAFLAKLHLRENQRAPSEFKCDGLLRIWKPVRQGSEDYDGGFQEDVSRWSNRNNLVVRRESNGH